MSLLFILSAKPSDHKFRIFILQPNPHGPLTTDILLNWAKTLMDPSDLDSFTGLLARFSSNGTLPGPVVLCSSMHTDVNSSLCYTSVILWASWAQIILSSLISKRSPGIPGSPIKGKDLNADENSHLPSSAIKMPWCISAKEQRYLPLTSNITLSKWAPSYQTSFCCVHRL